MSRKKFLRPKKKHKTAWAVKSQRKQEKKEAARAEKVLKLIVYYWKTYDSRLPAFVSRSYD